MHKDFLCSNHFVNGNIILNLILVSWKVICYSQKKQIEDLILVHKYSLSLHFPSSKLACFVSNKG